MSFLKNRRLPAWMRNNFLIGKLLTAIAGTPLIRRVITNSGYLFSAAGFVAVLSLVQNILIGRIVGVTGIGILATIIMFTSVINKFASFRMSELVIKYIGLYSENDEPARAAAIFKAACLVELLASLLAFSLACLLAPLGARWLAKEPALTGWFILYGLIIIANLVAESSTGLLQIFNRYRWIAMMSVLGGVVTLSMIAVVYIFYQMNISLIPDWLSFQGYEPGEGKSIVESLSNLALPAILVAYLVGKIASALGLTVSAMWLAGKHWGKAWWRTPLGILRPQTRELAAFATSTNISATLSLVNKDAEALWISLFRSPTETGYYKTALSLINLVQMPVSPLPQATYPELSREVARKDWHGVRDVLRKGSLISGSFTLVISMLLALLGQQLILLLYKDPGFLPAYPALLVLIPGFLVANTFYWNRISLLALGRPDYPTKLNLILAGLKLVGIFLLVPRFGYMASAALLSASYLAGVSIAAWKTRAILAQKQDENGASPLQEI
jgi:O-antigen/teichoic acid export membrane protein